MAKNRILFWIFILALVLRIFRLGTFPYGFHTDEVHAAWNALSILKTGHDDKGNLLPLYYNTFGDYRPAGIFYTIIPSLIVFGRTEFAVRFPSALIGALTVIPIYLFTLELTKNKKLGVFSSFLLAISPWHIDVSRATSETIIAAFLTLYALYYFIKAIKRKEIRKKNYVICLLLVFISYFFYHSTRVVTPVFFAITTLYFWKQVDRKAVRDLMYLTTILVFSLTLVFAINPDARGRLTQVSILGDIDTQYEIAHAADIINNKYVVYAKRFVNEYVKYFSPDFLIGYSARPYRYITPGIGILTFTDGVLLLIGIVQVARRKENALPLLLLLASPIPAALTTEDSPNLMRSLYMIIFIVIIGAYGLKHLLEIRKHKKIIRYATFGAISLNFIFFLNMYFNHSYIHRPLLSTVDMDNSSYRNIGNKEMALKLDGLSRQYEKIIVTGDPDNMYTWYAFFTDKNPKDFNKNTKQYGNIYFSDLRCPSDNSFTESNPKNLMVVDMWECAVDAKIHDGLKIKIVETTHRPDGSDVFTLVTRAD